MEFVHGCGHLVRAGQYVDWQAFRGRQQLAVTSFATAPNVEPVMVIVVPPDIGASGTLIPVTVGNGL